MKLDTRGMEPDEIAALQEKNATQELPTRMAGEALAKPMNATKSNGDDSKTLVKESSNSTSSNSSTPGGWTQPGAVNHVTPESPLSDYTVNNYKEGQTAGDSNLGGKEWSNYWKGANQSGRSEGYHQYGRNRAAASIASGKQNQSVNKSALQGRMDARESYYINKGKLGELNLYGDVDRTVTTDWQQPNALAPVEKPDLDPQKYLDQILDIKLDSGKSGKKNDSKDKNSNTNTLAALGVGGIAGGVISNVFKK